MPLNVKEVPTVQYDDQKPGTSGLRKKVTVFQQPHYLQNFVQATFNSLKTIPRILVIGGDGRFFVKEACQVIIKMAAANGVKKVWVGNNGLLSTPAVSAIIRNRAGGGVAGGAFILTASHNPGGPKNDFGIKYNVENGGPAPEKVTDAIFAETKQLQSYKIVDSLPDIDLSVVGEDKFDGFSVEVIDSIEDYLALIQNVFDFVAIRGLFQRKEFSFVFDALHGVGGPYAYRVFVEELGAPEGAVRNAIPLEDFGGGHPDPNLTYAEELVKTMGLLRDGSIQPNVNRGAVPAFGAACDGDADRNMIVGKCFFVTPSDSVAVLAANAVACIPFFKNGLAAVARSMPTSCALDRVATEMKIPLFEVPTGWKYFGNLMDSKDVFQKTDYNPLICGEESFGTGSNHVREKDGIWAVLAWLSILAHRNKDPKMPFVSVEDVVTSHWKKYGRNVYCRYDYEGVDAAAADAVMAHLRSLPAAQVASLDTSPCVKTDDFMYEDPVDSSVSKRQGVRVVFEDGSRFVVRLSGTGSSGATIRLYLEKYMNSADATKLLEGGAMPTAAQILQSLVKLATSTCRIEELTGRKEPTVIT